MALDVMIPLALGATALISAISAMGRGKIKLGSLSVDFDRTSADEIRRRLETVPPERGQQQYALLKEYHAQGLAQSRVSFWFSLMFASFGFAIIALAVGMFIQQPDNPSGGWIQTAGKPGFTLVSGAIIDAVSALFFVQSNKSRQLMSDFFDKLRLDRKLDEALKLANEIEDTHISSNLKAFLSINFAEVHADLAAFTSVIGAGASAIAKDQTAIPLPPGNL